MGYKRERIQWAGSRVLPLDGGYLAADKYTLGCAVGHLRTWSVADLVGVLYRLGNCPLDAWSASTVFFFMAGFGLAAQLPSQIAAAADHGTLQVTSGLGRKLYSLPDDQSIIDARESLAADPRSVERVLQLSKAEAGRRQYQEAVATSTPGFGFCSEQRGSLLGAGTPRTGTAGVQDSYE